jgi:hypothetical protein
VLSFVFDSSLWCSKRSEWTKADNGKLDLFLHDVFIVGRLSVRPESLMGLSDFE